MGSNYVVVTNNHLVKELGWPLIMVEGDIIQVVSRVRDMTLQGHRLLSHPLSGSVKPAVNPYKSILISKEAENIDYREAQIVQTCLEKVIEMRKNQSFLTWNEVIECDLRLMDYELIKTAIQSLACVS